MRAKRLRLVFGSLLAGVCFMSTVAARTAPAEISDSYAVADEIFKAYQLDAHVPGLVYGIVADGRLVHVGAFGVEDLETRRPVSADTLFRIASMTKAFTALTILKLRDDAQLRLDAPAADYVPEMRHWKYPTEDSPVIRVRDLLNHVPGFVTDDPWGDRQTPLPEETFTQLLSEGVPFTNAPQMRFEYSNLGYAILGRVVGNVSKRPYADTITQALLQPLGMVSSGFVADAAPRERRALGYRWEGDVWSLEPTLGPGAFGAMGGLQTSANDYAKWVAFLLDAWPPRNDEQRGPVRRSTVRELAQGSNYPLSLTRPARTGLPANKQAGNYGMGMIVAIDEDLGFTLRHSGGYPGYGSHVLLLPDRNVGIFAFANRTYAGPSPAVWDATLALDKAGLLGKTREHPVSAELVVAYATAVAIYAKGGIGEARDQLAMNFVLDRDEAAWSRKLAELKAVVGECSTGTPVVATGDLTGDFTWSCEHGRLEGSVSLAPTRPPRIQELTLEPIEP